MSLSQAFAKPHQPQQQERDAFCLERTVPTGHQLFEVTPIGWRTTDDTHIVRTSAYTEGNAFENVHEYAMANAHMSDKEGRPVRTLVLMKDDAETVHLTDAVIMQCAQDCRRNTGWDYHKTA